MNNKARAYGNTAVTKGVVMTSDLVLYLVKGMRALMQVVENRLRKNSIQHKHANMSHIYLLKLSKGVIISGVFK